MCCREAPASSRDTLTYYGQGNHRLGTPGTLFTMAELSIPRGSKLIGRDAGEIFMQRYPDIEDLELIRYSHIYHPQRDQGEVAPDDLLLVKGLAGDIVEILHHDEVEPTLSQNPALNGRFNFNSIPFFAYCCVSMNPSVH